MFSINKDFFAVIALALFVLINQFYLIPKEVIVYGTSDTYPLMINYALGAFTLLYFLEALRRRRLKMDAKARMVVNFRYMLKPAALLLAIWLWVELVESGGFLIPTAVLLAVSSLLYGERSIKKIVLLALVAPLLILLMFTALGSALPEGPLEIMLLDVFRSQP